ncbi:MAG: pantoate--beta-alanine ligase [Spirochaetes bacterium]|nr:pantoate--beta-alanine ligase [Spirochaetota bacterium]
MQTVHTIEEVRKIIKEQKKAGKSIGFIPTMGYLHQGHLSLVGISKKYSDFQVMSIFVNKIQFNDSKDYAEYPRETQRDLKLAESAGVDLVFMPDDNEMYSSRLTYVDVFQLTDHLCGAHREGHFRGVFTVVSKLFNIVLPDVAVFGQKDIQQAVSIEKMVFDLNFPVQIIIAPIVREESGLAMSSRNKHLSEQQRKDALSIHKSLRKAEEMLSSGEYNAGKIINEITKVLSEGNPDKIDYISVTSYSDLKPVENINDKSVIAIAAYFGSTRLIDNMIVNKDDKGLKCVY